MGLKIIHHRSCEAAATEAGRELSTQIARAKNPLLLLSSGSSLNAAKVMLSRLTEKQIKKLQIAQVDERFVDITGEDSNWRQIKTLFRGHIKLDNSRAMLNNGDTPSEIASNYSALLVQQMKEADLTIGLYGIGKDGHIAGMKPGKADYQFIKFLNGRSVVNYIATDFTRITTTTEVLVKLDKVIILACGKDKHKAIANLDKEILPYIHPAQLLKDAKNAVAYVNVGR